MNKLLPLLLILMLTSTALADIAEIEESAKDKYNLIKSTIPYDAWVLTTIVFGIMLAMARGSMSGQNGIFRIGIWLAVLAGIGYFVFLL